MAGKALTYARVNQTPKSTVSADEKILYLMKSREQLPS